MKPYLIGFLLLPFQLAVAASIPNATVDVYGTNLLSANRLIQQYRQELAEIADATQHGTLAPLAVNKITNGVKAKGDFDYVAVSPVFYQNDHIIHITVDVVEHQDKQRLSHFQPAPKGSIADPNHLVARWREYEKTGFIIAFKEKRLPHATHCPAHHCLFGFDHPDLKKYKNTFDSAERYKARLLDMARYDKDDKNRAAAVFILAHTHHPGELVNALLPSLHDSSALVRNNAMRVIGAILMQNKTIPTPINEICTALNYPSTTDRNKALFITLTLIDNPNVAAYIKQHAGQHLINMLKLEQPNNHDFSFLILKKMSGKQYGERDYDAWEKWLS